MPAPPVGVVPLLLVRRKRVPTLAAAVTALVGTVKLTFTLPLVLFGTAWSSAICSPGSVSTPLLLKSIQAFR